MPKVSRRSKPDYKTMLQKIQAIGRDWQKTFARLQKKQRLILLKLGSAADTKTLSKLRRTLS